MEQHDIALVRGETLADIVFALVDDAGAPINLTGFTARLEVLARASSSCVCASSSPAPGTELVELLSTSGAAPRLVIAGVAGEITFDVTSAHTNAWPVGEHEYRLWITDTLSKTSVEFAGRFTVRA